MQVSANWSLVESHSEVNFVTTKNLHVSEIHQFRELYGSLNDAGLLHIEISLASVETHNETRNTRMREKLFLVDKFPKATLEALIPEKLLQLKNGHSITAEIPAKLTIMAIEKPVNIIVQISKTMDGHLIATSAKPVLLGATDFGLTSGVELLQQLASLSNISLSVPVTFNVTFEPDK
jgi:polyisoprenoid-binding protein YceI